VVSERGKGMALGTVSGEYQRDECK